jgi:RHS repeat-associated protein
VANTFAGYQTLENGIQLTRYRAYDPEAGRWISADPSEWFGGSPNLYSFNANNAVNLVDPDGLASCRTVRHHLMDVQVPPYNDRQVVEDWKLDGHPETDGPDYDEEHDVPASVTVTLRCMWIRRVLQTEHWKRLFFKEVICTSCHGIYEEWEGIEIENYSKQFYRDEKLTTTVALPIILDSLLDPTAECYKRGYPGRRR